MDAFEFPAMSDYHHHARQGDATRLLAPEAARTCGRVLAMPNLAPPVRDAAAMVAYREQLRAAFGPGCEPVMTLALAPDTEPEQIRAAAAAGCAAVKVYPRGVTTNSGHGIPRDSLTAVWTSPRRATGETGRFLANVAACADAGLPVLWHGELPGEEVMDREKRFVPLLAAYLERVPRLRVVLEHVTTAEGVAAVAKLHARHPGRAAATITPHHLRHTHTDFCGGPLRPHLHCMPTLKNARDRHALVDAATSGLPCFFAGTDSAPHPKGDKESDHGCAGVWNAPVALETYAEVFSRAGVLEQPDGRWRLTRFTSVNGDAFYGLPETTRGVRLAREAWRVPEEIDGYVPYRAGEDVPWRAEPL